MYLSPISFIDEAHCFDTFFFAPMSHPYGFLVAAGSNHDLNNIYCNEVLEVLGAKMCNFIGQRNHTKKVKKIHIHPKYDSSVNRRELNASNLWKASFDAAILEIEPFELNDEINVLPGCLYESKSYSFGNKLLGAGSFQIRGLNSIII